MSDIWDFFMEVMLPVAVIALVFLGAICGLIVTVSYLDCSGFRDGTGIETRWAWGCYVKHEDQWVPKDYYFGKVLEHRIEDKR